MNKCEACPICVYGARPFKTYDVIVLESPAAGPVCVYGAKPFKTCCGGAEMREIRTKLCKTEGHMRHE